MSHFLKGSELQIVFFFFGNIKEPYILNFILKKKKKKKK